MGGTARGHGNVSPRCCIADVDIRLHKTNSSPQGCQQPFIENAARWKAAVALTGRLLLLMQLCAGHLANTAVA